MFRRISYLLFLLFISFFILSCVKKLVKSDENIVHPIVKSSITIGVVEFVNESLDSKLDIYSRAIPDRIISGLSAMRKVRFPLDYEIYTNKKDLIEKGRRLRKLRGGYTLKRFSDLGVLFGAFRGLPSTGLSSIYTGILAREGEADDLENYLSYYNSRLPSFPSYLGLSVNEGSDIKGVDVSLGLISLDLKDVFSSRDVYESVRSMGVDLLLLGRIRKHSSGVLVSVGLFDKNKKVFILRKDFSFTLRGIELNLNEEVGRISDFIESYLSSFPKGRLFVETEPSDALVFVDNFKFERTPFEKDLAFGFHRIEVLKEGYKKLSADIYIHKSKDRRIEFVFEEESAGGNIIVSSDPSGADVYLDLDYKGVSPLLIEGIGKGFYKVRVEKGGYKYSRGVVELMGGQNLQLFFPMEEGTNEHVEVEVLSRGYNIAKNIFLYSSFVLFAGTIYAYLYEGTYYDKVLSNRLNSDLYREYSRKLHQAVELRDAMLYTTVGLVCFTIIFQILELYTEDIEIGLTAYRRYSVYDSEDLALYFGFKF